jgi:hypothetical protein
VTVERHAGAAHLKGYMTASFGKWSRSEPRKWTANGIDVIYDISEGQGKNAGRMKSEATATIREDFVIFALLSPTSMWPEAFNGFAALVA